MKEQIKGTKQIKNDLAKYTDSVDFQSKIGELRKKYWIPKNGVEPKIDLAGKQRVAIFNPREWSDYKNKKVCKELAADLKGFITFPMKGPEWDIVFNTYLFFNHIPQDFIEEHMLTYNLCKISDFKAELEEYDLSHLINPVKNEKEKAKKYPIVVRISPYASRNVIVDFIDNNLDLIDSLQEKYKDPKATLGKTRHRPAKKKHDFIYKNKHNTSAEISGLVMKKYGGNYSPEAVRMVRSRKRKGA